jgi:queuine tRNA-ribosyltransferase
MFPREAYEPRDFFRFELVHQSKKPGSRARVGRIHTPHGVIDTPAFVAVGTNGTLKAVDHDTAQAAGVQLMFMNTYHLLLQPGPEIVQAAGGLHKFINRQQPIITDSGGFQVFSLANGSDKDGSSGNLDLKRKSRNQRHSSNATLLKVTEEGAHFRSYRDGRKILLTPESSVQTQKALGADIIIPLDELHPYHISREDMLKSLFLSHRWEARSLMEHLSNIKQQAMYAKCTTLHTHTIQTPCTTHTQAVVSCRYCVLTLSPSHPLILSPSRPLALSHSAGTVCSMVAPTR